MTRAELEEYVDELEDAIEDAVGALGEDDPDRALKILGEYVDPREEADQEEEPEEESEEDECGEEE